jgi:hypothetical protein
VWGEQSSHDLVSIESLVHCEIEGDQNVEIRKMVAVFVSIERQHGLRSNRLC